MDAKSRRQAELAERLQNWAEEHPSEDPAWAPIMARITAVSAQMRALTEAQLEGIEEARIASVKLDNVRRELVQDLLPHLTRAAKAADRAGTKLGAAYVSPGRSIATQALLGMARSALQAATADATVLTTHGLSTALLPRLTAATAQLEALGTARNTARAGHVGARVALGDTSREVRSVLLLLDSFNRLRYAAGSSELAGWKRTKSLLGAPRTLPAPPVKEDDVRPAA